MDQARTDTAPTSAQLADQVISRIVRERPHAVYIEHSSALPAYIQEKLLRGDTDSVNDEYLEWEQNAYRDTIEYLATSEGVTLHGLHPDDYERIEATLIEHDTSAPLLTQLARSTGSIALHWDPPVNSEPGVTQPSALLGLPATTTEDQLDCIYLHLDAEDLLEIAYMTPDTILELPATAIHVWHTLPDGTEDEKTTTLPEHATLTLTVDEFQQDMYVDAYGYCPHDIPRSSQPTIDPPVRLRRVTKLEETDPSTLHTYQALRQDGWPTGPAIRAAQALHATEPTQQDKPTRTITTRTRPGTAITPRSY